MTSLYIVVIGVTIIAFLFALYKYSVFIKPVKTGVPLTFETEQKSMNRLLNKTR